MAKLPNEIIIKIDESQMKVLREFNEKFNRLETKENFCEWRISDLYSYVKIGCGIKYFTVSLYKSIDNVSKINICPYCGKKIKEVN